MADKYFIARLTVYGLPLSAERVVSWLRETADEIDKDPKSFSGVLVSELLENSAHAPPVKKQW